MTWLAAHLTSTSRRALSVLAVMAFQLAAAQSGGGFGGSAPSAPPGGDFGGGFGGGGGSFGGGGFGVPLFYGGGGGGGGNLIGVVVFFVIVFLVIAYMRRSLNVGPAARRGGASALRVQLLLSEGEEVKAALQRVAREGDPDAPGGLARMLSEAALEVLRHPERWTYAQVERTTADGPRASTQVGTWAAQARAAFKVQTTSNYQDEDPTTGFVRRDDYDAQRGGRYLAVTLAAAAWSLPATPVGAGGSQDVRAALLAVAGVQPADLLRAEVVWSPDVEGEFLTEDQAIMKYPDLTKI